MGSHVRLRTFLWMVVTLTLAAVAGAQESTLTVEDYFRLRSVSEPHWSPEGDWVAYTVTSRDLEKDVSESQIFMVPDGGGAPVPLTAPGSSSWRPRFSPDGDSIGFLREDERDKTQVWTLFREGGDSRPVTDFPQGVELFEWAPDGRQMVLMVKDASPQELEAVEREKEEQAGKEETPPPWVIDRLQFKRDGEGYLDRRRTHLYLLDVETQKTRQLTFGDYDDSEPAWSPDGRAIVFVSNRSEEPDKNYNTDLWVVGVDEMMEEAAEPPWPQRLTTNPGAESAPAWSPDGQTIAYVSVTEPAFFDYATQHLAMVPAQGGEPRVLTTKVDRNVSAPRFLAGETGGDRLLFLLETEGEQRLVSHSLEDGGLEIVLGGRDVVEDFSVARDGRIAALVSRPERPAEVFALAEGAAIQLTSVNREVLSEIQLGAVEKVRYPSVDGAEIEAFVVKPPDFDPGVRHPTILWIHGGPQAQYDYRFDFLAQLLAARGYLVLLPNPRGSTGYGQEFCLGIWRSWGEKDYEDVMAAVDHAIGLGWADPDRLGVGGWSYGGMLTNHVISKTTRFEAAITGASATLYVANYGHDHYQRWWENELGLPWEPESRRLWERLSPFNRVDRIRTPTLIVGGEKDWNVPIINSEQLYQALRRLGRTTQLVVYPGEDHSIDTPSYVKDRYERYLAWFSRFVSGAGANDTQEAGAVLPGRFGSSRRGGELRAFLP